MQARVALIARQRLQQPLWERKHYQNLVPHSTGAEDIVLGDAAAQLATNENARALHHRLLLTWR